MTTMTLLDTLKKVAGKENPVKEDLLSKPIERTPDVIEGEKVVAKPGVGFLHTTDVKAFRFASDDLEEYMEEGGDVHRQLAKVPSIDDEMKEALLKSLQETRTLSAERCGAPNVPIYYKNQGGNLDVLYYNARFVGLPKDDMPYMCIAWALGKIERIVGASPEVMAQMEAEGPCLKAYMEYMLRKKLVEQLGQDERFNRFLTLSVAQMDQVKKVVNELKTKLALAEKWATAKELESAKATIKMLEDRLEGRPTAEEHQALQAALEAARAANEDLRLQLEEAAKLKEHIESAGWTMVDGEDFDLPRVLAEGKSLLEAQEAHYKARLEELKAKAEADKSQLKQRLAEEQARVQDLNKVVKRLEQEIDVLNTQVHDLSVKLEDAKDEVFLSQQSMAVVLESHAQLEKESQTAAQMLLQMRQLMDDKSIEAQQGASMRRTVEDVEPVVLVDEVLRDGYTHLRELVLSGVKVHQKTLARLGGFFPELRRLIVDAAFAGLLEDLAVIGGLEKLEILALYGVEKGWTDQPAHTMKSIATGCKALRKADLRKTPLDDESLKVIAEHCPNLERLWLDSCSAITVEGLKHLVRAGASRSPRWLQDISLRACPEIAKHSHHLLTVTSFTGLKELLPLES